MKLKRLFKRAAFIGELTQADVAFELYIDEIRMLLINQEKVTDGWESQFGNDADGPIIGYIKYDSEMKQIGPDPEGMLVVYVDALEVDPAYRDTQGAMYLMNYFNDNVLQPWVQQYGKDKVVLSADVVNDKLSGMLGRVLDKMGIKFFKNETDLESFLKEEGAPQLPEYSNDTTKQRERSRGKGNEANLSAWLTDMGFNVENSYGSSTVTNADIMHYVETVHEYDPKLPVYGVVTSLGELYVRAKYMPENLGADTPLQFQVNGYELDVSKPRANVVQGLINSLGNRVEDFSEGIDKYLAGYTIVTGDQTYASVTDLVQALQQGTSGEQTAMRRIMRLIRRG